jgi:hypothetical protein
MNFRKTAISTLVALLATAGSASALTLKDYFPSKSKLLEDASSMLESPTFIRQFSLAHIVDGQGRKVPVKLVSSRVVHKPEISRVGVRAFAGATTIEQTYRSGSRKFQSCLLVGYVATLTEVANQGTWLKQFVALNVPMNTTVRCKKYASDLSQSESSALFSANILEVRFAENDGKAYTLRDIPAIVRSEIASQKGTSRMARERIR